MPLGRGEGPGGWEGSGKKRLLLSVALFFLVKELWHLGNFPILILGNNLSLRRVVRGGGGERRDVEKKLLSGSD